MTTLTRDVAIGDTQLFISAALTDPIPGYVKIDSELLWVGGSEYRSGKTLTLSEGAKAAHSSGTTVTYAGREYNAAFLAALGSGGDGLILDNTVDPPTLITSLVAPGAVLTGDSADLSGLLQLRRIGPFNVAWDSDPTNISSAGVPIGPTFDAGTVILATWATRIQAWAPTITPNGYIDIYEALADSGDAGWATSFRTLKHYVDPAYSDTGGELAAGGVTETFIRGPLETGHRMYFAVYTDSGDPLTAGEADIYAVIAESA
jgi:hypothetical protein